MAFTTLRVQVNETTLDQLTTTAAAVGRDPEFVAANTLAAGLAALPPSGRFLVLAGDDLQALEDLLAGGTLTNSQDLRAKVERLAGISFQHIRLLFTPGQLEEMQRRAERQGMTVETLVSRTVPRIHEQFFNLLDVR
jgi:hypothetical protein